MQSPPRDGPIIVIGMHRSGTTMIVRMLEALGNASLGKRLQPNIITQKECVVAESLAADV